MEHRLRRIRRHGIERAAVERSPDKDGNFWMPYYGRGNEVARLNPTTGEVQHFSGCRSRRLPGHSVVRATDEARSIYGVCIEQAGETRSQHRKDYRISGFLHDA